MEPAHTIVDMLGGPSVVAGVVGLHRTRVSNWARPREKGGTGGVIPHWHVRKLIEYARSIGKDLTEADFALPPEPANASATPAPEVAA